MYWVNRIKIRITNQNLHTLPHSIKFTAINMGEHRNSFDEKVVLTCLMVPKRKTILYGEKHKIDFYIHSADKSLHPHRQKNFEAISKNEDQQLFTSVFRKYRFCPNRGMFTHVYFKGPLNEKVSYLKFHFNRFLYQYFRRVPSKNEFMVKE